MKVLVSGAGGFLGRYVTDCLVRRGHTVRAIVRPASINVLDDGVEIFPADLRVHDNLVSAFDKIDAVMHLAATTTGNEDLQFASTVVATERFMEAMVKSSVKRLIHVSSFVVYDWERAKGSLDENTPLLRDPYSMGAYTIAKVWQERVVRQFAQDNSWDLTVMRPGFIWGPQHAEIAGMGRHFGRAYILFGPFTRLPLSHVENCADCLVAAAERTAAIGETFNVVDSDQIRVWRYVAEYTRRTNQRGIFIPIPYTAGHGIARLASFVSRHLYGGKGKLPSLLTPARFESQFKPLHFSNQKLKNVLAWQPTVSFQKALSLTYG